MSKGKRRVFSRSSSSRRSSVRCRVRTLLRSRVHWGCRGGTFTGGANITELAERLRCGRRVVRVRAMGWLSLSPPRTL